MYTVWGDVGKWGLCVGLALTGACTFLIDVDRPQCEDDAQCRNDGLGGRCEDGVCVGEVDMDNAQAEDCDGGMCETGPASGCGGKECTDKQACFDDHCLNQNLYDRLVCEADEDGDGDGDMSKVVTFRMHTQEFILQTPPTNLKVAACRTADATCLDPEAEFEDSEGTGDIELELPLGFMGFLELKSDDTLTALWYLTEPLADDTVNKDLLLVSPLTLSSLALITGYDIDTSKGLAILEAFDCDRVSLGGVHFDESKGTGQPFYIVDEAPNVDASVTKRDDVNDIAIGGFINVEVGFVGFEARLGPSGPLLNEFNARIRANTITYIDLHR